MLKNFLRDYFTYSRGERTSIVILLIIIIILITANFILPVIITRQEFNYSVFEKELEDFKKTLQPVIKQENNNSGAKGKSNKSENTRVFKFNPNTADASDLENLGFSERVIENIVKYRIKGGIFYKKTDLLKIYGIDTTLYFRLAPYVYLYEIKTGKAQITKNKGIVTAGKISGLLNINKADTGSLKKELRIDNSLSETIIKYRNILGGYYNEIQFREIYGIKDEQYDLLCKKVFIDTALITKINLNRTDESTLEKHPYLNIYQSKAIIKYRNYKSEIANLSELLRYNILDKDAFIKIRPYLSVD